jgi:hypothetical protein
MSAIENGAGPSREKITFGKDDYCHLGAFKRILSESGENTHEGTGAETLKEKQADFYLKLYEKPARLVFKGVQGGSEITLYNASYFLPEGKSVLIITGGEFDESSDSEFEEYSE